MLARYHHSHPQDELLGVLGLVAWVLGCVVVGSFLVSLDPFPE